MASTTTAAVDHSLSWVGLALWRLSAGILYAFALLLVPSQLPAAVLLLLATLLCLPGNRAACRRNTGLRLGAGLSATGVAALLLGAVLSAGWQTKLPISLEATTVGLVVAATPAAKP